MTTLGAAKYALGVTAAALILVACSSGGSQFAPGSTGSHSILVQSQVHGRVPIAAVNPAPMPIPRPDHRKSWMNPSAKASALLYISDYVNDTVYVYSWPKLAPVGTLTGLSNPAGMCVDRSQNIWISNSGASNLIEFAHGGIKPIATLNASPLSPWGCAVDPKTGNLAVTNMNSTNKAIWL